MQNGDYDKFGRLMITNSSNDIEGNTINNLKTTRIFQHDTTEHLIENIVKYTDDVYLTLSFLQT